MEIIFLAAIIGLLPAFIAKRKGRMFGIWWFYGVCPIYCDVAPCPLDETQC
jgi:hypothetical protein